MKTEGSRMLSQRLAEGGKWNAPALGKELRVTRQAVSYWADGTSRPTPEHMAKLEDLLDIPMRAWATRRAEKKTGTDG